MRPFLIAGVILALTARPAPAADANADPVEIELKDLAEDVAKALGKEGQKEIAIGPFVGKGNIPTNFGPEMQRILIAEFRTRKIGVSKDARVMVSGSYFPATEDPAVPNSKLMFIRVNAVLENTMTGLQLGNVNIPSRAVYGNEALARAFAPSTPLSPDEDRESRNGELNKRIKTPEVHKAGSTVRSKSGSPFAVEILVDDPSAPDPASGRAVEVKDGLAFVDVRKKEYYRVKIHNTAPFDVAVRLSIDGLDQFVFADAEFRDKDGRPRFQYMVVPKGKAAVLRGWFRTLKQADSFVVTEYAKSAVAELNASQGDVGQICVQFYAAWEKDMDKPRDEPPGGGKDGATGRGEKVDVNLVPVKRQIGVLRDQVSIRYSKPK